ncbi:opsin 8, group member b [Megalobrama amblycephala]|uniref:opsin 8, group member b n=1 Tax=Megalobrama amblycephala TaxID=75352 RepID=UPI0020141FAA|nr:opsin 8, group member b [Megalobrama amblycephala]
MDIYSSKLLPAVDYGVGAFLLLIAILSIVGNLMVLVMAYKRSNHMKPPELLSVNLAVTDLGAAVTMYPLAVASAWNHHWIGGDVTCVYYGLMGFFFGAASMMTLTIMAIVRFVVSLTLQSPKEKISKRNAKILVVSTWLYALLWAIFPLIGWGKYGPEPFGLSCTLAWRDMKEHSQSFVITIFLMNLIFPAIIIMSCYSGIALKLYVTYKSMDDSNRIPNMIKMQRRLMAIAVLISIGYVGSWAPYGIVSLWSIYRPGDSISPEVSMLPCLFAKTSTVYNPFIYYIFSKTFKREINQLGCFCGRSNIFCTSNAKNSPENTIFMVCDTNKSKPGAAEQSLEESRENETQLMPNQNQLSQDL